MEALSLALLLLSVCVEAPGGVHSTGQPGPVEPLPSPQGPPPWSVAWPLLLGTVSLMVPCACLLLLLACALTGRALLACRCRGQGHGQPPCRQRQQEQQREVGQRRDDQQQRQEQQPRVQRQREERRRSQEQHNRHQQEIHHHRPQQLHHGHGRHHHHHHPHHRDTQQPPPQRHLDRRHPIHDQPRHGGADGQRRGGVDAGWDGKRGRGEERRGPPPPARCVSTSRSSVLPVSAAPPNSPASELSGPQPAVPRIHEWTGQLGIMIEAPGGSMATSRSSGGSGYSGCMGGVYEIECGASAGVSQCAVSSLCSSSLVSSCSDWEPGNTTAHRPRTTPRAPLLSALQYSV